jgi:hypothetical protein
MSTSTVITNKFSSLLKSDKVEKKKEKELDIKPKQKKPQGNTSGFIHVGPKNKKIETTTTYTNDKKRKSCDNEEIQHEQVNEQKATPIQFVQPVITQQLSTIDDKQGNNCFLNSSWTVWVHRNDCADWSESSYICIYVIDSIGSFWRFFNNFHTLNKEDNQFFIMRNRIKPIWEDNNNRTGGICSLKMDCYDKNNKTDIGSEVMISLCILVMNETLLSDNSEINGISYSIKNRSVLIKIWSKDYSCNISERLPKNLINKFSSVIKNNSQYRKHDNYVSIRYSEIKPEN